MSKKLGDPQASVPKSMGELGQELARGIRRKDERYERFVNFKMFPKMITPQSEGDTGLMQTRKKVKAVWGGNRSSKTQTCLVEALMVYTGIIPDSLKGVYGWEKELLEITQGPKKRPRYVRIVVMDYPEHWEMVIKPKLEDRAMGLLPEAWSDFDKTNHIYTGPDGSVLDIFSADPTENTDPRKLRGGQIDHTWIDEINREQVYTESRARTAALEDGPMTVSVSYCPQEGLGCWTYETFHNAGYERKGQNSRRLPFSKCHPDIYSISVCMKDNPLIGVEEYERQCRAYRSWEIAFRVHGQYSNRTESPYFAVESLIMWEDEDRCTTGMPYEVVEEDIDLESGRFTGRLNRLQKGQIEPGRKYDETSFPVWRVWELPQNGRYYVLTADPSMGSKTGDYHSCSVWDVTYPDKPYQVAHLRMRNIRPGNVAVQCACMAWIYGKCLIMPECNAQGGGMFIDRIRHYPNMYKRVTFDQELQEETSKVGFNTTRFTKGPLLDNAHKRLVEMATLIDDDGKNHCPFKSRPTLKEFISYEERIIKTKDGVAKVVWAARKGAYDDCVIDACLMLRVAHLERHKLSACKIIQHMVDKYNDKHYLGEASRKGVKPFSNWKKQKSLGELRKRHGVLSNGGRKRR